MRSGVAIFCSVSVLKAQNMFQLMSSQIIDIKIDMFDVQYQKYSSHLRLFSLANRDPLAATFETNL